MLTVTAAAQIARQDALKIFRTAASVQVELIETEGEDIDTVWTFRAEAFDKIGCLVGWENIRVRADD